VKLRPYQQRSVDAICDYFRAGNRGSPIVALPTGASKSVVQRIRH
jgi:superfamily II DNA or RNA helicase